MRRARFRRVLALAFAGAFGAASLSGVEIAPDERKVEPLARDTDAPAVLSAQERVMGAPARYAAPFPVFIHLSEADSDVPRKIHGLGGRAAAVHPRLYAGAIPRDAARYVSNWPSVVYIEAGKIARPLLDRSRPAVQADIVQSGGPPLSVPYTGVGTFVGIVDTGVYKGHPDFYTNGNWLLPRVKQWFPSEASAGNDGYWHGTSVAGIAAGNGYASGGLYTGMAPGADLLVYKSTFQTTDIPPEVDTILLAAGASPVAVNLSLGVMTGPHDGTSGFEQSLNAKAAGALPRVIVVAAGNERDRNEHFRRVLPAFGSTTANLTIAPTSATGGAIPMVDIWADGGDSYTVTPTTSAGSPPSVSSDAPPNGSTHFEVFFNNTSGADATGSITLQRTRNGGTGRVDAYIDIEAGSFDPFVAEPTGTLIEPGNAGNVITVGSFNTRAGYAGPLDGISSFSSLGPTRDGRRKPDVAAPGAAIYSPRSRDTYIGGGSPPTIVPGYADYAIVMGTSMAAPHVTGIAALAWQSNPTLSGAQMRARLVKTANLPQGATLPDNTWGYGKVNALQAVSRTVASITAPAKATPNTPVALSSENSSGAFNSSALSYAWALVNGPSGPLNTPLGTASTASFTPTTPGDYTVSLTVSQSAPAGVPAGTDIAVVHVNTIPVAAVSGPSATDNVVPVTFTASAIDSDVANFGQTISYHWILVSRPAASAVQSAAPYFVANGASVTLAPDNVGVYEIGLRADDGLDNSAMTISSFRSGPAPPAPKGGGGGCSVARPGESDPGASPGTALLLLLATPAILLLRRVSPPAK